MVFGMFFIVEFDWIERRLKKAGAGHSISFPFSSEAPPIENDTAETRAARGVWARLIKKIYEVDTLICSECSGPMRIISIIEEGDVIRKIMEHLKLWEEPDPRPPPAVPEQVDIQYVRLFAS